MELKHLNLVDETNGDVSKRYIILHYYYERCSMGTKELNRPKNRNRLCTQFQLNDAKFPETQTIYTAE